MKQDNPSSTELNPQIINTKSKPMLILTVLLVSVLIKLAVGLSGYSGLGKPPMFGDFEAQRHWLEIAFNLDLKQWYYYKPSYWLLDYPPLTAYHSWFFGYLISLFEPSFVELSTSEGLENIKLKFMMRLTSVATDLLFSYGIFEYFNNPRDILTTLINPLFVLVDHGHFQYNSFFLGLSLLAMHNFRRNNFIKGSVLYCLALNFKQMSLYYSMPIFIYLLSTCIKNKNAKLFVELGATVILTNLIIWSPFIITNTYKQVFARIFPINRGLFEDKVANFWCLSNVIIKYKKIFKNETMLKISTIFTIMSSLPSLVMLYKSRETFLYSVSYVSLCFFLFGFQVHEKTIMIPLLPILMLDEESMLREVFTNVATFSISPLLFKDGQIINTFAVAIIYNAINKTSTQTSSKQDFVKIISYALMIILAVVSLLKRGSERYPDLLLVVNVCCSSVLFHMAALYLLYKQYLMHTKEIKSKRD